MNPMLRSRKGMSYFTVFIFQKNFETINLGSDIPCYKSEQKNNEEINKWNTHKSQKNTIYVKNHDVETLKMSQ